MLHVQRSRRNLESLQCAVVVRYFELKSYVLSQCLIIAIAHLIKLVFCEHRVLDTVLVCARRMIGQYIEITVMKLGEEPHLVVQ